MADGFPRGEAGGRPVWMPDTWWLGVAAAMGALAALDAFAIGSLPVAWCVWFGVGAPVAVVVVRGVSALAGARRGLSNLLSAGVACGASGWFGLEVLAASGAITDVTFRILVVSMLYAGTAAMLLLFDGEEIRGRVPAPRSLRTRFGERPALRIVVAAASAAAAVALLGIPLGGETGLMVAVVGGGVVVGIGVVFFGIRDVAAGGDGRWP